MPAPFSELFDPLFAEATQLLIPNIPVEGGVAFQPDSVRQIGELRADAGEDIVGLRMFDTEMSFTPLVEEEAPSADPVDLPTSFFAIIDSFNLIAINFWEYHWTEVTYDTITRTFNTFSGARISTSSAETTALNRTEFLNTSTEAAHGVILTLTEATGVVVAIPINTPIQLFLAGTSTSSTGVVISHRVFSEVNAINFDCI